MTTPKFKSIRIEAYKPGKSKVGNIKNITKLSANESALGISPKAKKIISNRNRLSSKYPDSKSKGLRREISKVYNCDFNQIICGSGSDEIIQIICQLFLRKSDAIDLVKPIIAALVVP